MKQKKLMQATMAVKQCTLTLTIKLCKLKQNVNFSKLNVSNGNELTSLEIIIIRKYNKQ